MASEFRPRLTIRTLLGDLPLGEFEFRMAQGPRVEGDTGDSSWVALYGYIWAVAIINDAVVLLQAVDSSGSPLPIHSSVGSWRVMGTVVIPHSVREIKHIGLAFDQAARPMITYERNGEVWVRQWDPVTQQYIMRGPYPGVDPVLICDASVMYKVPDSDVLLFYLSTDRTQLLMRVQRENFANPYTLHTFTAPVLLDQVIQYPYRLALVGSRSDSPAETGYWLNSYLYPVNIVETAVFTAAPHDVDYAVAVIRHEPVEGVETRAVPLDADYYPSIIVHVLTEGVNTTATPLDAMYTPALIAYTHKESIGATGTPQDGIYAFAAIRYAITEGVQASATPLDALYTL